MEDHAKAIDMVQEKGRLFETYNVGGHNEKQNIEIIEIIIETLQEMLPDSDPRKKLVSKDLITYVADRKGHDRRYAIAPDKIKAAVDDLNKTVKQASPLHHTQLSFKYHEDTNRISITVTDSDTDEVIREIPPEKTLDMLAKAWEMAGLLVDERR